MSINKYFLLFIKIIVTGALSYWLITKIDFNTINSYKQTLNLSALWIAAFFVVAQFFTGFFRWCVILPLFNVKKSFSINLQIYWIGMFFNNCLPTGVAGDAIRIRLMQQPNIMMSNLINIVFFERLSGLLMLIFVVEISVLCARSIFQHVSFEYVFPVLAISGLIGFLILSYLHRLPISWQRFRLLRLIQQLSVGAHSLQKFPGKTILMFLLATSGIFGQVLAVFFLARSLHLPVQLSECFALIPPVILVMAIPISIGGWGIREGAMVTFFSLVGISATAAFSLSVLFGALMMLVYLPGGIFWIFWRKDKRLAKENNTEVVFTTE